MCVFEFLMNCHRISYLEKNKSSVKSQVIKAVRSYSSLKILNEKEKKVPRILSISKKLLRKKTLRKYIKKLSKK